MEEILASIRRIIADDQPLGAPASHEPAAASRGLPAPDLQTTDLPMASETAQVAGPAAAITGPAPEHGAVAAPQSVPPESTAGFAGTPHPLAPHAPEPVAAKEAEPVPETARHVALPEPDPHEAALQAMHEDTDALAAVNALHEDTLYEAVAEEPPMHDPTMHDPTMHEAGTRAPIPPRDTPAAPSTAGLFSAATSQSLASAFNTLAVSRLADDSQELRGLAREMLRPLLKDWLDDHLPGLVESIIREEIDRMARRAR